MNGYRQGVEATQTNEMRSRCCCDRCHAERVVPERLRRMLERDAKREGNGGAPASS
jgi:hypothetical protein